MFSRDMSLSKGCLIKLKVRIYKDIVQMSSPCSSHSDSGPARLPFLVTCRVVSHFKVQLKLSYIFFFLLQYTSVRSVNHLSCVIHKIRNHKGKIGILNWYFKFLVFMMAPPSLTLICRNTVSFPST